ncbi:MAG TPA: cytochrome c oxidase subunit II [Sulfurovum sp.]|nr:cytochrome c oxidase subunit II [Sulfurovum sp.]
MSNTLEGFNSQAATFAADVDQAFWINFWISIILFLSVVVPMIYFAWKYRADKVKNEDICKVTHNTSLELAWTLIPTAMLFVLFYYGYTSMKVLRTMPAESQSIVVHVEGKKWSWNYTYPANKSGYVHKTAELYVPKDQNIILKMTAPLNDVLHAFYVPAFRMKEDVVPGRITKQWFNSEVIGTYDVECAEYCGTRHSYMYSKVHVIPRTDYDEWFESKKRTPGAPDVTISKGQELYESNGCAGCHSIDTDAVLVGPSLKGIGAKYDAAYLKDAIVNPDKDIPEGFTAGVMPPFTLPDADIDEIINYFNNTDKGKELYEANGCAGCHSIDSDAILVGPSLKGIGAKRDAAYLKDAILHPDKDVPEGFTAGVMPPFTLPDADVSEIIRYMQSAK